MPEADGSPTLEELAGVLFREEAEVAPAQDVQFQQPGQPAPTGAQPAQIVPPGQETVRFEQLRSRFLSGQPLSAGERDAAMQLLGQPGGTFNLLISERAQRALGKEVAATVLPSILGGGLGLAGGLVGRMGALAPRAASAARALGVGSGSLLGTEANQALGLETESDLNSALSFLLPIGGAAASGVLRRGVKASGVAQTVGRQQRAELAERLPQIAFNAPLQQGVDDAFRAARQSTDRIDFGDVVGVIQDLPEPGQRLIAETLQSVDPALLRSVARGAIQGEGIGIDDIISIRRSIREQKRGLFGAPGTSPQLASQTRARELDEVSKAIDDAVSNAAARGSTGAQQLQEALVLSRKRFAQRDLTTEIRNNIRTNVVQGGNQVSDFNLGNFLTEFNRAEKALDGSSSHHLTDLVRSLDEVGDRAAFKKEIQEISRQLGGQGIQLVPENPGVVTRAVGVGLDALGGELLAETLTSPTGRQILSRYLNLSNGRVTPSALALLTVATRASLGQHIDDTGNQVLEVGRGLVQLGRQQPTQLGPTNVRDVTPRGRISQ